MSPHSSEYRTVSDALLSGATLSEAVKAAGIDDATTTAIATPASTAPTAAHQPIATPPTYTANPYGQSLPPHCYHLAATVLTSHSYRPSCLLRCHCQLTCCRCCVSWCRRPVRVFSLPFLLCFSASPSPFSLSAACSRARLEQSGVSCCGCPRYRQLGLPHVQTVPAHCPNRVPDSTNSAARLFFLFLLYSASSAVYFRCHAVLSLV